MLSKKPARKRRLFRQRHGAIAVVAIALLAACASHGIDKTLVSPISNDDTFAMLDDMWAGVPAAIQSKREPSTDTFNLALTFADPCSRSGTRSYQGTLAGTKSNGSGTATLNLTASLTACEFDNTVSITKVTATGITVTGTIKILNDTWDAISLTMIATSVTVNDVLCPGGVNVMLTGTAPSAQPVSTGTSCGRVGAVNLP